MDEAQSQEVRSTWRTPQIQNSGVLRKDLVGERGLSSFLGRSYRQKSCIFELSSGIHTLTHKIWKQSIPEVCPCSPCVAWGPLTLRSGLPGMTVRRQMKGSGAKGGRPGAVFHITTNGVLPLEAHNPARRSTMSPQTPPTTHRHASEKPKVTAINLGAEIPDRP